MNLKHSTHKDRLASVRKGHKDDLKSSKVPYDTLWEYEVVLHSTFPLPEFEKPIDAFWAFYDSYEGPQVHSTGGGSRVSAHEYRFIIYRSQGEEYFKSEYGEEANDPDDDKANIEQLLIELDAMTSPWKPFISWEVDSRIGSDEPIKETLRTKTKELGEHLGPFIAKYVGTDFDYAQFGAAVLDEINDHFIKEQDSG